MATLALTTDLNDPLQVDIELEGVLTLEPAFIPPPTAGSGLKRHSEIYPAPTINPDTGKPVNWKRTSLVDSVLGHLQVVIDGRDRTYFRGLRTLINRARDREPGGDWDCELVFPGITAHDHPGSGAVAWLHDGAHIGIRLIPPTGPSLGLWTGMVMSEESSYDENVGAYKVIGAGVLAQADLAVQTPGFRTDERDIGDVIYDSLNTVISRDYLTLPRVHTGVPTRKRGSGQSRLAFCTDLLGEATTSDGLDQWTLHTFGWAPRLLLKNRTDIHATMRAGQRGLTVNLTRDRSQAPNVIFGEGTRSDGMRWRNTKHPGLRDGDPPLFPLDPDAAFTPGGSDTGFAPFAQELRDNGISVYSADTYDARDEDEVKDWQRRHGISDTGNVGAATWNSVFAVGVIGGNLWNVYQAPVSQLTETDPWTYNAEGAITDRNPAYDPFLMRVERYENMGEGTDLAHGRSSARGELNRTSLPVWSGTITLREDPNEISRWRLKSGMNFLLQGHHGIDRQLHIAEVDKQPELGIVVITVDQANRDLLTLHEIHERNKDSATDPNRRPARLNTRRRGNQVTDTITIWDGEARTGRVPAHAAAGGEWQVRQVPGGQAGTLSRVRFWTTDACEFAIGLFGKPVTAVQLQQLVGNPLTNAKPWDPSWDKLFDIGMFASWGGSTTPAGYSPGAKGDGDPLSGYLIDDGGTAYYTDYPGWLWVAEFVSAGCVIQGHLDAAVEGV